MKKTILVTLSFFLTFFCSAQVGTRWYNYGQYLANSTTVSYTNFNIWNDTTATFGSPLYGIYQSNNFVSVGLSFDPFVTAWNNPALYGNTIRIRPSDAYTIDSVRIQGSYMRNPAKPLVNDTLVLSFVYGNGTVSSNLPDYYFFGSSFLGWYGADTINFLNLSHDSIHNRAGSYTGVPTAPYVQKIVLTAADGASSFDRVIALNTPFAVPAHNCAAMSLTFVSGDPSFITFDTVTYISGTNKYGAFAPKVEYAGSTYYPAFPPYSRLDSNAGYFKVEGSTDAGWGGKYIPNWAWTAGGSAAMVQYPVIEYHINCPTCPLNDSITGKKYLCGEVDDTLHVTSPGGTWSSSNPSVAIVGASTGIVTGLSTGVVTITYTHGVNYTTTSFTVDPVPGVITGTMPICTGDTAHLSNSVLGGRWTSSSPAVASVGSVSGILNPITAGTVTITYTIDGHCSATWPVTVNASPLPITGDTLTCMGATDTLADATPGGTWHSSNVSAATINTAGHVTPVSPGATTITYLMPDGCAASLPVTVSTLSCESLTGVPATESSSAISIYPNPVHDELNVTATEKIHSLTIASILGQTVYSHACETEKLLINVALLPPGIYLLKINETEIRKFIKE